MMKPSALGLTTALTTLLLAGCNAGPLLKTGSLSATAAPSAAPAQPKPSTPVDRALFVAATSARAQKCGFYFDAGTLRSNFLAAEATRGTSVETLATIGKSYDYTALKVAASIKDSEAFCGRARTASIRKSLQGALAGNFEPPPKKAVASSGGIGDIFSYEAEPEKFDTDALFDPVLSGKKKP